MMIEPLRRGQRVGEQRGEPQRREDVGLVGLRAACRGSIWVIGSIGGIANALLMQAVDPAELLERLVDAALTRESSSVMSVGTTSAPAAVRADHLGHLLEPPLGAADEHQVGAHLGGLLAQRPAEAGADAGEHDDLVLQQGDGGVALLDRGVVGLGVVRARRQLIILRATERCRAAIRAAYSSGVMGVKCGSMSRYVGERDHLDDRAVLGAEVALEPLPAQHHRAGAVAGGLQPVGDAGVALAR